MTIGMAGILRGRGALRRAAAALPGRSAVADVSLATAVLLVGVPSVLTHHPPEGPVRLTLPVALAFVAAVALRSRLPLASVGLVTVAGVAQAVAGSSPGSLWAFAALLLVGLATGQVLTEGPATVGLVVLLLGLWLQEWLDGGEDYLFILLVFGGVWLLGRGLRAWRTRAHDAEQHQRDLARLAVAQERVRIARELHDVVAHGLSVIAVQADAAEAALGHDPARAQDPLLVIQSSAREALGEMRQMLALLRTDADDHGPEPERDEVAARVPARGVRDLPHLVGSVRRAGLEVTSSLDLAAEPDLPPGLQLAIYRIAQEGLTNVVKHAGSAPTRLRVRNDLGVIVVEVENDAPSPTFAAADVNDDLVGTAGAGTIAAAGHGLVGVRERVLALGGTSGSQRTATGGHLLWARLPSRRLP